MKSGPKRAARRTRGEGTVQKCGDKFRGVITTAKGRLYGPLVASKPDALPEARKKAARLALDESPSLSSWARKWLSEKEASPTTLALYSFVVEKKIAPSLGDMPVRAVQAHHAEAWLRSLGGSDKARKNALGVLLAVLRSAGNPIAVKAPRLREGDKRVLTPEERDKAFNIEEPESWMMVRLALGSGLRRSEMAGLQHRDRVGGGVHVKRAVVNVGSVLYVKPTKTAVSNDWVPLHPDLLDVVGSGKGYVLGDSDPPDPRRLSRVWAAVSEASGLKGVGLHDLRRTFGVWLLETGTDVRAAAELMRHDPTMLLRVYARSRQETMSAATARLFPATPPATPVKRKSRLAKAKEA